MRGAVPPLPHYTFMAWCSIKKKEYRMSMAETTTKKVK
jgi:hypothetical protein